MNKVILLLLALALAPWARTWEDAKLFYYYAGFEDDSLNAAYNYSAEEAQGIYFYGEYGYDYDSMEVRREHAALLVRNDTNGVWDSVWISKYWMDDSLLEEPVVMDADVDRDDFRLLTFDALHTEYDLWPLLDERAENADRATLVRESLFLLYRKDSSYYALCLIGYYPDHCDFYISCQFQDDGTTNFGKIPDIEDIAFYGCVVSLPKLSRRPPAVGLQEGVPYQINGTRSRGGASSVIIDGNRPKVQLRK